MKHVFIQSTCTAEEIYQPIVLLINLIFIVCLEHQQCQWLDVLMEAPEQYSVNQNMTSQKRQTSICCLRYPGV